MKPLLDAKALSQLLGVPKSWVYEKVRQGEIPTVPNLGRYRRFDPDVIERMFFNEQRSLETEYRRKSKP